MLHERWTVYTHPITCHSNTDIHIRTYVSLTTCLKWSLGNNHLEVSKYEWLCVYLHCNLHISNTKHASTHIHTSIFFLHTISFPKFFVIYIVKVILKILENMCSFELVFVCGHEHFPPANISVGGNRVTQRITFQLSKMTKVRWKLRVFTLHRIQQQYDRVRDNH